MAQIEFDMRSLDALARRMNEADEVVKNTLNDGLRDIGKLFVPTKGSGPLANATPRRTGKLARSSFFIIDADGPDQQKLTILQPAQSEEGEFYGGWVREGTGIFGPRGGRIYPTTKKALAWGADLGGGKKEFVFRSTKGQKPNPYHIRVLERSRGKINDIIRQMGVKVTAHIAGD